jgi:ribonuclease VapC
VDEPEANSLARVLAGETAGIGAPTLVETAIVLTRALGGLGRTVLGAFLERYGIDTVPFDAEHWPVALDAFTRYGKGRHPAGLNFGDCFTYAVARVADEPLLCLGEDFAQTDLEVVAV